MQFKDLFHKKNISKFIIFGIVIFLCLPLIFPEKNEFKIIRKESAYVHEDSPLPIFPKESLLDKYVNRFKIFYKINVPVFGSKDEEEILTAKNAVRRNSTTEEYIEEEEETNANEDDIDITKEDLFFSAAFDNEDDIDLLTTNVNPAEETQDLSVNLQKGTVLTKDGLTLEPTQEGYYHNGKFYKNGTYPHTADRRQIEGALSRYHSRIAKSLGKKALYLADEKGNLTVSYVEDFPNETSTDIDTYLARNKHRYQNITTSQNNTTYKKDNRYDTYSNSKITDFDNEQTDNSDIFYASIKDMHAAYNLLNQKIQSGQIGQGLLPNPANLIPLGNILLNQTSVAQPPMENPEDEIYCQGNECADSLRVAPIVTDVDGFPASDLDAFYHALCLDSCPYSNTYNTNPDRPFDLDINNADNIEQLKEEIAKSDKKILEISYINPSTENEDLVASLQEMSLTNKNGEPVEIRLRGIEKTSDDASFGDKMVGPFKNNITRDLTSESNEVSYETLVERYNKVDENVQDNIEQNKNLQYYKEFYPNLNFDPPVAFVEKSEDPNFFIINNPDIPKGYVKDIPEWNQYKKDDGLGPYYRVPKEVLFNPPSELTIIAVQDGKKRDIVLQDGHPVGNISKEVLQNLNFNNVEATKTEITSAQIDTIIFNAQKLDEEEGKEK